MLFFRLTSQFSELLSCNNTGLEYCALISAMKYVKSYSARRIAVFGNRDILNDQKNAESVEFFNLVIRQECDGNWHYTTSQSYRDAGECYFAMLIS